MRIAVPTETVAGERRVALIPKSVSSLISMGADVAVHSGAGRVAGFPDSAYADAGATIVADVAELVGSADVILKVQRPSTAEVGAYRKGSVVVGILDPVGDPGILDTLNAREITAFRLEALPRLSRVQDMDVLSAMSTVSGYAASLLAASRLPKIFPLLMTAAGTITPARVFVLGAGVAGLQAIATCRRLGAVVEAYDIRPAVKEQVESLGAKFVVIGLESATAQDAGGYATALGDEQLHAEHEALGEHVAASDIVITTAFVPNQTAPTLVTAAMVKRMRPGSVIVDLAAASGGNCELTVASEEVLVDGVLILGPTNLPATIPGQASQLYSHSIARFLSQIVVDGAVVLDLDDEVLKATCMTHAGVTVDDRLHSAAGAPA